MATMDQESINNAIEVMQKGLLNRYQMDAGAETNYLLKTERALAAYIGTKYCLGLNSGGSAIFLSLKCADLPHGTPVLSNAFTFNAVPSAIEHAGCRTILVECTGTMVIDLEDLERKAASSGAKVLVLSYMRGRIPDMDKVMEICKRLDLYLIEDSAHAYGCEWKGRKIGTFGASSCISTQANKIMNSGEGGFLCTDDDDIMAKAIIHAGSYEELFMKHCDLMPPRELMLQYRMTRINYSIRMTNLQGAILLPQASQIDVRRDLHNAIYAKLVEKLEMHPAISVPPQLPEVTPVYDSIQFNVEGLDTEKLRAFQKRMKEIAGMKMEVFSLMENARNWRTWKFIEGIEDAQYLQTDAAIQHTCDTRLGFEMTDEQIDRMASAIHKALDDVWPLPSAETAKLQEARRTEPMEAVAQAY